MPLSHEQSMLEKLQEQFEAIHLVLDSAPPMAPNDSMWQVGGPFDELLAGDLHQHSPNSTVVGGPLIFTPQQPIEDEALLGNILGQVRKDLHKAQTPIALLLQMVKATIMVTAAASETMAAHNALANQSSNTTPPQGPK